MEVSTNCFQKKISPEVRKLLGVGGGIKSAESAVGKAGKALKNSIGKNNNYMMIYGIEQVSNGVTIRKMKTPSKPGGNRKRVGPTSFQDLLKPSKWKELWN